MVSDDLILTAAHVVEGASSLSIEFPGTAEHSVELVHSEPGQDTALLRLTPRVGVDPLVLSESGVEVGDQVGVVGYPLGMAEIHVNRGAISSIEDDIVLNE